MKNNQPIGIFDSGVGGLTVLKEIIKRLPNENIIYLGDTKHLPYGAKSKETVTRLSTLNIEFLLKKNVKAVVIACNTTSALSLKILQKIFSVPLIGVVQPGALAAALSTRNKRIGVIGTEATINSKAYVKAIKKGNKTIKVFDKPCPLFVPLVEEGWINDKITYLVAKKYLLCFNSKDIDTVVLGCTHYPFLKKVIKKVLRNVTLIDSATETAKSLVEILKKNGILNNTQERPNYNFFVTDAPQKFKKTGTFFLKSKIKNIKLVHTE